MKKKIRFFLSLKGKLSIFPEKRKLEKNLFWISGNSLKKIKTFKIELKSS